MRDLVLEDDPILKKRAVPFDFDNPQEDPYKLTEELMDAMEKYEGIDAILIQTDNIDGKFIIDSTDNKKGTFTFGDDDKFNSYSDGVAEI